MKAIFYIFVLTGLLSICFSMEAGLTEDELKPYEKAKVLPPEMTAKEISEWPLQREVNDSRYVLDVKSYNVRLDQKEKARLEKKNKVRFHFGGYVLIGEPEKRMEPTYRGLADVYIISTGEKPQVVAKKRISLKKFCPS